MTNRKREYARSKEGKKENQQTSSRLSSGPVVFSVNRAYVYTPFIATPGISSDFLLKYGFSTLD